MRRLGNLDIPNLSSSLESTLHSWLKIRGKYQPKSHGETESTEIFDLKPSLKKEFQEADLIISHCGMFMRLTWLGAGTLLECL